MREIIIRNIDNAPNGKEFFAGISGNFKNFGQTLCELIDNPISNFHAHGIRGRVEIVLEEQGDYVDVSVRDNGTGIENMDAALTIAARSCAESTLNEHGMGLKHALASINAGEDQHWSIQTRTAEDVANDRYQRAEGPYDIHMPVSMIPGSGEVAGGTGTVVRVRCPMHKFLTLKPASKKDEPTFGQMAAYLRETLRYTYANLLRDKAFTICFTAVDKSGASDGGELAGALEPNWRDGQMTELPPVETDLGGGPVTICCRYGSIRRSKENAFYYRANMASSGAEIRINGRAIQHGLYNEIWGKALHPSQNRFLAQIDILSDQAEALPDTKAAKNGLREDDEKVAALFSWIRANIPEPFKEEGREQMLVRLLAEKKSAEPGVLRVSTEKNLYQCLNLQIKSDLFVSTTEGVTLFEAKAGGSKAEDLYQLRMYHDGCVADDMEVREAVLIAQRHPDTVRALLAELNRQKDKKGRLYHFALTTWDEEGIASRPTRRKPQSPNSIEPSRSRKIPAAGRKSQVRMDRVPTRERTANREGGFCSIQFDVGFGALSFLASCTHLTCGWEIVCNSNSAIIEIMEKLPEMVGTVMAHRKLIIH